MVGSAIYIGGGPCAPASFRKLRVRTLRLLQRFCRRGPNHK
jgi:hypothetical protein